MSPWVFIFDFFPNGLLLIKDDITDTFHYVTIYSRVARHEYNQRQNGK